MRILLAVFAVVACTNLIIFGLEAIWFSPVRVASISMAPKLHAGDRLLVNRRVSFAKLHRGDLVVVRTRTKGSKKETFVVKRVVGAPGDSVEALDNVIAVNGTHRLDEPYARWGDSIETFPLVQLKQSEIYVMGDNRSHSRDSRTFGPVKKKDLVGVVQARFWPFARIGTL